MDLTESQKLQILAFIKQGAKQMFEGNASKFEASISGLPAEVQNAVREMALTEYRIMAGLIR